MDLRIATEVDFETGKQLTDALVIDSKYNIMLKNLKVTQQLYDYFTKVPTERIVFIGSENGEDMAILILDTAPVMFTEDKMGRVLGIYVKPEYRGNGYRNKLLDAFEYWSGLVGCKYATLGITAKKVNMKKRGYIKFEELHMKEIA